MNGLRRAAWSVVSFESGVERWLRNDFDGPMRKKKEAPENSHRLISGTSSDSRYKRLKSFLFEFFKI